MRQQDYGLFIQTVWQWYHKNSRQLPWRPPELEEHDGQLDAYKILVSEFMLQQTQVARVVEKYRAFITQFPTIEVLAQASVAEVLSYWQGLVYNRRALYLHQAAQSLCNVNGMWEETFLVTLKGIGPNTAAAICVYAYNIPLIFIETNVRTVYLHHFFRDQEGVNDNQLLPLLNKTLEKERPREWYWALMDYGSYLKKKLPNPGRGSHHYKKQSAFEGSQRQLRGSVLALLLEQPRSITELKMLHNDPRLKRVLADLEKEGFIVMEKQRFKVT